jgi:hypothetical protein
LNQGRMMGIFVIFPKSRAVFDVHLSPIPVVNCLKPSILYILVSYDSQCKQRLISQTVLIFLAMEKRCIFSDARTDFLNVNYMSFCLIDQMPYIDHGFCRYDCLDTRI